MSSLPIFVNATIFGTKEGAIDGLKIEMEKYFKYINGHMVWRVVPKLKMRKDFETGGEAWTMTGRMIVFDRQVKGFASVTRKFPYYDPDEKIEPIRFSTTLQDWPVGY